MMSQPGSSSARMVNSTRINDGAPRTIAASHSTSSASSPSSGLSAVMACGCRRPIKMSPVFASFMTPAGGSSAGYSNLSAIPVSRRVEAERNTLPIGVAYLPLTAVLLGDYPIKLERFAGIEIPRILPQMLTQEFAPQWADDCRVPDRRIHLGVT